MNEDFRYYSIFVNVGRKLPLFIVMHLLIQHEKNENKFALLWGEAQKKIAFSYPKVTYSYPKVT